MKIETTFDLGDSVFFMHNNRVEERNVASITAEVNASYHNCKLVVDPPRIYYIIVFPHEQLRLRADEVFATKKDLLRSL